MTQISDDKQTKIAIRSRSATMIALGGLFALGILSVTYRTHAPKFPKARSTENEKNSSMERARLSFSHAVLHSSRQLLEYSDLKKLESQALTRTNSRTKRLDSQNLSDTQKPCRLMCCPKSERLRRAQDISDFPMLTQE